MSIYFETKTDSGLLQITDNQSILYLSRKTTLSTYYVETKKIKYAINGGSDVEHDVHIYSLPISGEPMYIGSPSSGVAHVFPTHVCYIHEWRDHNPVASIGKHNVLGISNVNKDIADNMMLYLFSQDSAPNTNLGLECYNSKGNRIFSSATPVMKLLYANLFTHCAYGDEWDGAYKDLSATHDYNGKSIAFNCSKSGYYKYRIRHSSESDKGRIPLCLLSSGKVQMVTITHNNHDNLSIYTGGSGFDYSTFIFYECMNGANQTAYSIIDVTNY